MNHLAERTDIGREISHEIAEDGLLDRQSLLTHKLKVTAHAAVPDPIDSLFDNHRLVSSRFSSSSARKRRISVATRSGASIRIECLKPGRISSCEPGMRSCMKCAMRGFDPWSSSPVAIKVGTLI